MEITAVGGYKEIGKNMTAVKIGNDTIILDMGIHLENFISYTEDRNQKDIDPQILIDIEAIPNDKVIEDWRPTVKAIIPSHAHLDHLAAIPFIGERYKAPVIATPFTLAVLKAIVMDNKMRLKNNLIELNVNNKIKAGEITVEFVNVTHSTPQTVIVALHTKEGIILYACDFKLDDHPGIGKKPNYKRLEELGKIGVKALIVDSTYSNYKTKMPSEAVAKAMLEDVLLSTDNKDHLVIVTTFSSHLARIKEIIEIGKKMNRKIVLLGRSLSKYILAGVDTGIFQLPEDVELVRFSSKIKKSLRQIKDRKKYLLIVTGHQGETKATLSKMVNNKLDFRLNRDDHVIFSCTVIPTESNIKNREELEEELEENHVRIFKDIHVSGHAAREDIRYLLNLTKPKNVIPAHGSLFMRNGIRNLALEMGYTDENIVMFEDGQRKEINN